MQAIAVTGPEAVDEALAYEPMVDYILLDSVDPAIAGVGAAGIIHDWEVSAAIVRATKVPVILAGDWDQTTLSKPSSRFNLGAWTR